MHERSPYSSFIFPLLSGVILSLLFYRIIPALFICVALVPLFVFLDRTPQARRRFIGGFLTGGIYFLAVLHTLAFIDWFGFVDSEEVFMRVAYVSASVYAGILYGFFAMGYTAIRTKGLWMLLYVPALFVLAEAAKRIVPFGFTWGFLGYLVEDIPLMVAGASIAGVLGLTALIVLINTGVTLALFGVIERSYRKSILVVTIVISLVVVFLVGTKIAQHLVHEKQNVRVAVMETGDHRGTLDIAIQPQLDFVQEAIQAGARIILLPENIIDPGSNPYTASDATQAIQKLVGDYDGTIIVGGIRTEGDHTYNSAFFWHEGAVAATYDKHYLVPFAEYTPTFFTGFAPKGVIAYERGAVAQHIEAGGVQYGVLTCQEINYPEAAVRPTARGADMLVSGAHDGFVDVSPFLAQYVPSNTPWLERIQYGFAKFRAAENGRYLLRSTKVGIAGVIDPNGSVVTQINSGTHDVHIVDVALMGGKTLYTRVGDVPLLLVSTLVVLMALLWSRHRKGGDSENKMKKSYI